MFKSIMFKSAMFASIALFPLMIFSIGLHQLPSARAQDPLTIASIGASYASGHGIDPQIDGNCHRSGINYSHLVTQDLAASLTDVTCSGATTDNFSHSQGFTPPQYAILNGHHDIMLVSIGSNDIQLVQAAIFCAWFGNPVTTNCDSNRATTERLVPTWKAKIDTTYQRIRELEPTAKIYAISYGSPLLTAEQSCRNAPWNQSNRMWIMHKFDLLSRYTKAAVEQIHGFYVDASKIAAGHEICSADPWYVGTEDPHGDGFIIHPKAAWHRAIAAALLHAITSSKPEKRH